MAKIIKEYSFCTCEMQHDSKKKCLYISFMKRGKVFFSSTVQNVKSSFAKVFASKITESDLKDMLNHNMTIL